LRWSVLRLFATYGAGHKPNTHQGIVNIMLTQLMRGGEVVVRGSLDRVRDIIYVDDAARGICEALFRDEASGEIFNLGTQVHLTIGNIIDSLAEGLALTENDFQIKVDAGTVGDPFYNVADCSKARQILNFIPEYDFKRGAAELIKQRRATSS
jgi:nucleoside-diphosphate-sugar epimerase